MSVKNTQSLICNSAEDLKAEGITDSNILADRVADAANSTIARGLIKCYDKYFGKGRADKLQSELDKLQRRSKSRERPDVVAPVASQKTKGSNMTKVIAAVVVLLVLVLLVYFVIYPKYLEWQGGAEYIGQFRTTTN